jgi:hypothetical protein
MDEALRSSFTIGGSQEPFKAGKLLTESKIIPEYIADTLQRLSAHQYFAVKEIQATDDAQMVPSTWRRKSKPSE